MHSADEIEEGGIVDKISCLLQRGRFTDVRICGTLSSVDLNVSLALNKTVVHQKHL